MKAALITAPGAVEVTTVPDPTPGPGDVVVEVAATGLCGTDLHIRAGEHGRLPVIPGHEVAGTVVAVGRAVEAVRVGDPVAVDPSLPCGGCTPCRRGRANLCVSLGALGVTAPGGAAQYMRASAARCVVLPSAVDVQAAALIEPLSCAVRGYDVLSAHLGDSVLIYGAGTMGLLMFALAQRTGAVSVDVIETNPGRQALVGAVGGAEALGRDEWDIVIDATGNAAAIQDGLGRVARGGTFLQFGVSSPQATVTVSPYRIYNHEITITGSMAVLHSFERAADLFVSGVIDPAMFITHRVPLEDVASALDAFARGEGIKTQVVP